MSPNDRTTARALRAGFAWTRWLLAEALVWAAGIATGLALAGGVLLQRAHGDVAAYLANPPRTDPSVIYSAPVEVRTGLPATVPELAGDLLSAGYVRVDDVDAPGEFSVSGGTVEAWTEAFEGPGVRVPGGRSTVVVKDGRIARTDPSSGVVWRPTVLATIGDLAERRDDIAVGDVSPWLEPAILAMEDERFREHVGVDVHAIVRAFTHNLENPDDVQGGSTLTQQLAKNLFLSSERTYRRKVREAFFAAALEMDLTKDEILSLYLGEIYLGQMGGVPLYGVDAASRAWWGTDPSRLTLAQAATIAGVIAAPNQYSPARHPERAKERRELVLDRMVALDLVTAAEADEARQAELEIDGLLPGAVRRAPWAVDAVVDAAEDALGAGQGALATGGWRVHTTIQPLVQRVAEEAVRKGLADLDRAYPKARGAQGALVSARTDDGAVLAVVGSRDYVDSPFNRAVNAWRQIGSTVKPLTYLAAFEQDPGMTPIDRIDDTPLSRTYGSRTWTPGNYDGTYRGTLTVRQALESSRNVPAVRIAEQVGNTELEGFLKRAGLSRASGYPSQALGAFGSTPWEMVGAYSVFPNGGTRQEPWIVRGIADRSGQTVRTFGPSPRPVASPRAAGLVLSLLEGVMTDGTAARSGSYGVRGDVGGKTGTTDRYRDAWFVGFSPDVVTAVWVGRDRKGTIGLTGGQGALPTWSRFMVRADALGGEFRRTGGLTTAAVCTASHMVAGDRCPSTYDEVFPPGGVPDTTCRTHGWPDPYTDFWRLLGGGGSPDTGDTGGDGRFGVRLWPFGHGDDTGRRPVGRVGHDDDDDDDDGRPRARPAAHDHPRGDADPRGDTAEEARPDRRDREDALEEARREREEARREREEALEHAVREAREAERQAEREREEARRDRALDDARRDREAPDAVRRPPTDDDDEPPPPRIRIDGDVGGASSD